MTRISAARTVSALALLALAGCKAGPDYVPPTPPTTSGYISPNEEELQAAAQVNNPQRIAMGQRIEGSWWQMFHSPELDQLVKDAIAGNPSIIQARATLTQFRDLEVAAGASFLPTVTATAGLTRQHFNFETTGRVLAPTAFTLYSVGAAVSYSFDPAGGTTRTVEQADATAVAQGYQLDAAYMTITGQVVSQALTIAALREQLKAINDIIASDQQNVDLVNQAKTGGTATNVDLVAANSQLANDRTLLPPIEQQLSVARHLLATLQGKAPADWKAVEFDLSKITLPQTIPVSVPSELVRQRPDVLTAEAQLHAASAGIGVIEAQKYPSINLVASIAQGALDPSHLFDLMTNSTSFGPAVSVPLFDGGSVKARTAAARAAYQASLASYQTVVLTSFRQVADSLTALTHDADELDAQDKAVGAAQEAVRLARLSYQAGNTGVLAVLDPDRLYQEAVIGRTRALAQRYLDTAQLFTALGGGWWNWEDRPGGPNDQVPVMPKGPFDGIRKATDASPAG